MPEGLKVDEGRHGGWGWGSQRALAQWSAVGVGVRALQASRCMKRPQHQACRTPGTWGPSKLSRSYLDPAGQPC